MKPKAKSRTSAQITGDHFLKLGLAEMREFVEYVADKPDGKDALTILEQRISDQRKADLKVHQAVHKIADADADFNPTGPAFLAAKPKRTAEDDIKKSDSMLAR